MSVSSEPGIRSTSAEVLLPRLSRMVLGIVCVGAVAGACMFAYYRMYSDFRVYDDEGNNMIAAQGYMLGNPLVEEVYANYGPFLYVYHRIVHAVSGQALTHDFNRMHVLVQWMIASLLSAGVVFRLTRSWVLSGFVFFATVLHLDAVSYEPGSAQSLTALGLLCTAFVATFVGSKVASRWALIALGVFVAAITFTKVNTGALAIVSVALMSAYALPRAGIFAVAYAVFFAGAALLPRLLIGPESWSPEAGMIYPTIVSLGIVSIGLVGAKKSGLRVLALRSNAWIACAFVATSGLIVGIVMLGGTSAESLVDSIWTRPLARAGAWVSPLKLGEGVLKFAWISLALAATTSVRHRFPKNFDAAWSALIVVLKAILCGYVVAAACRLDVQTLRHGYLLFVPWYWLVLVVPRGSEEHDFSASVGRVFLAALGTMEIMQIYPAAMTHAVMSTVYAVPIAGVLLRDVIVSVARTIKTRIPEESGMLWHPNPELRHLGRAASLAAIALVFASTSSFGDVRAAYRANMPLDLPGAERIRLAPHRVATYTWLANNLRASDTFATLSSLGSLYFWTEITPPTYFVGVPGPTTVFLNEREQRGIIEALEAVERPYYCSFGFGRWFWRLDPGASEQPLGKYFSRNYRPFAQAGQYRLFAHKKIDHRTVREMLLFGEKRFDGASDIVVLPPERFDSVPQSLSLWMKTDRGGVVLGQQRDGYAGVDTENGVPMLDIGDDGLFRADLSGGAVPPMRSAASMNDGTWHWVVVTSSATGRVLYLDGVPVADATGASPEEPFAFAQIGAGFSEDASAAGLSYFSGSLADVSIWHRLLSPVEIATIYRVSIELGQVEPE